MFTREARSGIKAGLYTPSKQKGRYSTFPFNFILSAKLCSHLYRPAFLRFMSKAYISRNSIFVAVFHKRYAQKKNSNDKDNERFKLNFQ